MTRNRAQRSFVAWLAIAALWLLVAAPTVSRVLPAWMSPDLGAWCTGHGFSDEHPSSPDDLALHTDKCGYCALLGHNPLLASGAMVAPIAAWLPLPAPAVLLGTHWHALPLLSANPRGPPLLHNG